MKCSTILFPAAAAVLFSQAAAAIPKLSVQMVVEKQLQSPTCITSARDGSGRLFVCEQRGQIRIIKDGMLLPQPFLDVGPKLVSERTAFDERGLLGLAFHPQFGQVGQPGAGRFYVFYSAPSPNAPGPPANPVDCRSTLAEYRLSAGNPGVADPGSERILLSFDKPQFNHNGGQVEFGPDGFLYFSTGDGGSSNDNNAGHTGGSASRPTNALGNSQDLTVWMGKIHRINPLGTNGPGGQYGIPADNPLVGTAGVREEIWAYGLRNPWRFTFDRANGRLFCADVGQGEIEEVDIITKGANYGWRNKEGTFLPTFSAGAPALTGTVVDPIAQYAHPGVVKGVPPLPQIGVSITGGILYRGSAIPGLQGKYICGDYSQNGVDPLGVLIGLEENAGAWTLSVLDVTGGNPIPYFIQSFGEDESGEIYIGAKRTRPPSGQDSGFPAGALLKIVAPPPPQTISLSADRDNSIYSEADLSNALGQYLFTGRTAGATKRRALVRFDLSAIPADATVQSASLTLTVSKTIVGNSPVALHRLTKDWGEATSTASGEEGTGTPATPGDATWAAPFQGTGPDWTATGGDFAATATSSASVGTSGSLATWNNLAADVQGFLAAPATNHGWILVGTETGGVSAKRYASRHNASGPPELSVTYVPPEILTRRQQWERQYFLIGQFIDPAADPDFDGTSHLMEYALDRHPLQADGGTPALRATGVSGGLNFVFIRDPRATDLTYRMEVSPDGTLWTAVVTSAGGAAPTGAGFVSEQEIPGSAPLREVTGFFPTADSRILGRLTVARP